MNKDSICFILPGWVTKHTGGAEWQLYLLSEKFIKEGWFVEVITQKGDIKNKSYINNNIKYFYYRQKVLKSRVLAFALLLVKLFSTRSYYYYVRTDAKIERAAVRFYTKLTKKKYIFALSSDEDSYNKNFSYTKETNFFNKIDVYFANIVSKNGIKADLIIAQTETQKQILLRETNLESFVIYNSSELLVEKKDDTKEKENIILWVGNVREVKQPELFLEIVEKLSYIDWKFIMIGQGTEKYKYLEIKYPRFNAVGSCSYSEVNEYFKKAKILVNTSLLEGFSNTFVQSWFYKLYVISLNADPDSILHSGKLGFYAKGNTGKLLKALENLTYNDNYLNKDYLLMRETVLRKFDLDSNFKKITGCLKEIR